jgi:hypothetical protein
MNETEKDRILRMVAEGTLRPNEAAHLLAALADEPAGGEQNEANGKEKAKPKPPLMEVQMQRPDGTQYTIQVPPNLFPMVWQITKVAIKESARNATQEAWSGFKHIVRTKTAEVKTTVKSRVSGSSKAGEPPSPEQEQENEARRRILQMVQNGRITALDASKLIQQLDALAEYEKAHPSLPVPVGAGR